MIHVLAIITALPGQRAAVLEHFHANIPAVKAEQGCVEYGPVIDAPGHEGYGPDTFVVIEKWTSTEALQAHARAPHMAAYAARVKELLAKRAVHVMQDA